MFAHLQVHHYSALIGQQVTDESQLCHIRIKPSNIFANLLLKYIRHRHGKTGANHILKTTLAIRKRKLHLSLSKFIQSFHSYIQLIRIFVCFVFFGLMKFLQSCKNKSEIMDEYIFACFFFFLVCLLTMK